MLSTQRLAAVAAAILVSALPISALAQTQTFTVDCARGQKISKALTQGDLKLPMVLVIRGTCTENVMISRDDVWLQGQSGSGATVSAADAALNTIEVRGTRNTISGLTIQGGANGLFVLAVSDFTITDSVVKNAGQNGIYVVSTHVKILRNVIQNNGSHGLSFWAADGRVETNQILSNAVAGVHLERNSTVGASGNTITGNGSNGIEVLEGSHSVIAGNTISQNGSPTGGLYQGGIDIRQSQANIRGGNSITNNATFGVHVVSGQAEVSNSTITGNGHFGVAGDVAATLDIVDSTISGNTEAGVSLRLNSTGRIAGSTIQNNGDHGIRIRLGTALMFVGARTNATGNGVGLICQDNSSRVDGISLLDGGSSGCSSF